MDLETLIKVELTRQKLRQIDSANRLGMPSTTFSSYLRGAVRAPNGFREDCERAPRPGQRCTASGAQRPIGAVVIGADDPASRAIGGVGPMVGPDRMDLIEWYAELGWALVPLVRGGNMPRADVASGWSSYRLARADVRATFADGCNVGVLLGEPSHGLLDGDLDCKEALELAPLFLPDDPLTFGRLSTPKAHALYIGSSPAP